MTATTALTAQNTLGVQDIHHIPPPFLKKQIDVCIDDIGVDVVKTGVLGFSHRVVMQSLTLLRHARICRCSSRCFRCLPQTQCQDFCC